MEDRHIRQYEELVVRIAIRLSKVRDLLKLKTFEEYREKVIDEYLVYMREDGSSMTDGWSAEIYMANDFDSVVKNIWFKNNWIYSWNK